MLKKTLLCALFAAATLGGAQAATLSEDFNGAFPAWESGWFGANSDAVNYYCGARDCATRGNNPDGLWLGGVNNTSFIDVSFGADFGASITELSIDVAGYTPTTLRAYDSTGAEIFAQSVALTYGAFGVPGTYTNLVISSAHGISHFSFDGWAAGNTSIDNIGVETGFNGSTNTPAVPEPESYALMMAGLGVVGFLARRRKA